MPGFKPFQPEPERHYVGGTLDQICRVLHAWGVENDVQGAHMASHMLGEMTPLSQEELAEVRTRDDLSHNEQRIFDLHNSDEGMRGLTALTIKALMAANDSLKAMSEEEREKLMGVDAPRGLMVEFGADGNILRQDVVSEEEGQEVIRQQEKRSQSRFN